MLTLANRDFMNGYLTLWYTSPFCDIRRQSCSVQRLVGSMRDFRDLMVWHKSHELTLAVYRATRQFPRDELYGLRSQIRRSSASIPANIAEGCGRGGAPELRQFLQVAMGSASELEYHLLLANDLTLLAGEDFERLSGSVTEVKRMLTALIVKLRAGS